MSREQKSLLSPVLVIVALGLSIFAFAATRREHVSTTPEARETTSQNPPGLAGANQEDHVRIGRLWPQLRWNLKALGDRLQKAGKERLTVTATLSRLGDPQAVPVLLVSEFPDHFRMQIQGAGANQVITFNGNTAKKDGGRLDEREEDLVETLVYDTAEHFFAGQSRGAATRFLGDHFRLDDGTQQNYSGPYYDVYQTTEQMKHVVPARGQTKLYCFNSRTLLLERINYELERIGSRTSVEIQIAGWQQIQGQQVPTRIVRLEGGRPALKLTISSWAIGPKIDDGIFDQ